MLPDRESNPGPLTYESDALPIALHGPARKMKRHLPNKRQSKASRLYKIFMLNSAEHELVPVHKC